MISLFRRNLVDLPINYSLNYYWCSGFVLSVFMGLQILTGIILSFLYIADSSTSFECVLGFSNDVFFIWCLRYWHIWGVSILFILLFVHMGRALYYSSHSMKGVWNVGFILYLLTMGEAFTGYILPWHQMSYWAATVLTSIVDSLPLIGPTVYKFIVGGFAVTEVTLIRVFSVHVCLGFIIVGLMMLHSFFLHRSGSNNPLFRQGGCSDIVFFHSYFTVKDFFSLLIIIWITLFGVFYIPDFFMDVEGYIEANPLSTPVSIKPEWYFLIFYAMLRCIESKIGGMALILSLLFLLWVPTTNQNSAYSIYRQLNFWIIVSLFFCMTYLGGCHPEYPYLEVCKMFSFLIVAFMFTFKLFWSSNSSMARY
uniref:cytochrome b n=1 Tax=Nippotaenia mogurndae TaxID=116902 RepID=UPI0021CCADED|nr:cytochrome b [Nippotaenia mogurndae]UWT58587.1 cytochrome b [Nippotaenia mogurndae]